MSHCNNNNSRIPWKFYASRALSSWGDRLWDFGCGVFMAKLDPLESLRLVGLYGLISCVSMSLSGASIGNWIDGQERLKAAKIFLAVQNSGVAVCCSILTLYFWLQGVDSTLWHDWSLFIAGGVISVAVASNLASAGSKIVVIRDWSVVISGEDKNKLASINSTFRTIDLMCLLVSPVAVGLLFDYSGEVFTAIFLAAWNLTSVVFEYKLLSDIYRDFPDLAKAKSPRSSKVDISSASSWKVYLGHPVRFAGLALACVYMSVLGYDNITYAFCLHQCVSESILGLAVGASACVGMAASAIFPLCRNKTPLHRLGLLSFSLLLATLLPCVVSIWLPGSPFKHYNPRVASGGQDCESRGFASVAVLMISMMAARFGLWMSDLSVTQIMQESVHETQRGLMGGVQEALNYAFETLKYALVIALPEDDTFGFLILASYAFYFFATVSFFTYFIQIRKTIHFVTRHEDNWQSLVWKRWTG